MTPDNTGMGALASAMAQQAGKGGSTSGFHWSDYACKQRLTEVMGRMAGDRGLLEKLLLHQGPGG